MVEDIGLYYLEIHLDRIKRVLDSLGYERELRITEDTRNDPGISEDIKVLSCCLAKGNKLFLKDFKVEFAQTYYVDGCIRPLS